MTLAGFGMMALFFVGGSCGIAAEFLNLDFGHFADYELLVYTAAICIPGWFVGLVLCIVGLVASSLTYRLHDALSLSINPEGGNTDLHSTDVVDGIIAIIDYQPTGGHLKLDPVGALSGGAVHPWGRADVIDLADCPSVTDATVMDDMPFRELGGQGGEDLAGGLTRRIGGTLDRTP